MSVYFYLLGKVFALIIGLCYFRFLGKSYKIILLLVAIASICESYGYYLTHFLLMSNAWLFNLYMIIEVWLMGAASIYLIDNRTLKKVFFFGILLNTIVWVFFICSSSIYVFANIPMICGCSLIMIIYTIVLFRSSLFSGQTTFMQPVFWVSISTILYFGGDIPYMGLHNYLVSNNPSLGIRLANINTVLDVIRYPLVAISFILLGRNSRAETKAA